MNLKWILEPEELKALEDLLNALDKTGITYIHDPDKRPIIKIRGNVVNVPSIPCNSIYLEQNRAKKIKVEKVPGAILIRVADKKKPIPIEVKIPESWRVYFSEGYLYIFY